MRRNTLAIGAGLAILWMIRTMATGTGQSVPLRLHVDAGDLPWMTTNRYPEWFRKTYRYRELVGKISNWQDASAAAWKGVPNSEIRMGALQLDRGAVYPFHFHPAAPGGDSKVLDVGASMGAGWDRKP